MRTRVLAALHLVKSMLVHLTVLEAGEQDRQVLLAGLEYLLNISFVNDDEVLKICLDFWHFFVLDVFDSLSPTPASSPGTPRAAPVALQGAFLFGGSGTTPTSGRRALYAPALSRLRVLMISRMAKPEEV